MAGRLFNVTADVPSNWPPFRYRLLHSHISLEGFQWLPPAAVGRSLRTNHIVSIEAACPPFEKCFRTEKVADRGAVVIRGALSRKVGSLGFYL